MQFAVNHPYLSAGVVLGSQIFSVIANPVIASQMKNKEITIFREQHQVDLRFETAVSECMNEENATAQCAEKLVESWKENGDNLERQNLLTTIVNSHNKLNKYDAGYVKPSVERTAMWSKCTNPRSEAGFDKIHNKCQEQYNKWADIAESVFYIFYDSKLASKQNILDVVTVGDLKDPVYSLEQRLEYAQLSNYPYRQNSSNIPADWSLNKGLAKKLAVECHFHYDLDSGQVFTLSGLVAYMFDKTPKSATESAETCLVFGGSTAGIAPGDMKVRFKANSGSTTAHLYANVASTLALQTPSLLIQAKKLARSLESEIQNKGLKTKMTITGHFLGGGLCSYAAAMTGSANAPTSCYGFASAPLNGAS